MDMQNVLYVCLTQIYLEDIIGEISQLQKDKYHVVLFTKGIRSDKLIENEVEGDGGGLRKGTRGELMFKGSSVCIWEEARFWRWVMVTIAQQGKHASC